ncbi:MAG: hypothetical protein M1837_002373 [Sclerophora amabilis]|nr:MAG: hypothetical protein M1837_002373 [Sclerophora amabilis]
MPPRLAAPVLTVDAAQMHELDTRNVDNLFGMWTVFSKCAESMEEGKRLENLTWRLWTRETFCCQPERTASGPALAPPAPPATRRCRDDAPAPRRSSDHLPELSASVESASSSEFEAESPPPPAPSQTDAAQTAPLDIRRPAIERHASAERRRGTERHITSLDFQKMVITIKEKKDLGPWSPRPSTTAPAMTAAPAPAPAPAPTAASAAAPVNAAPAPASAAPPAASAAAARAHLQAHATDITPRPSSPTAASTAPSTAPLSTTTESVPTEVQAVGSDTSAGSGLSSHSIVRGFAPGHGCSSYRSQPRLAPTPIPARPAPVHPKADPPRRKGTTVFMLGGSSGEEESSLEEHMQPYPPARSSLSDVLKRSMSGKKQTSFKDEVTTRTINERALDDADVFSDEDDEDIVSESAIDDDDSSEWEDSVTESGRSSVDERPLFQRVDSKSTLTSRRSLLTSLMHQPQRAAALANAASRSTPAMHRSRTSSPNGPSLAASPEEDETAAPRATTAAGTTTTTTTTGDARPLPWALPMQPEPEPADIPRSKPIIMTTSNTHPPALSPRTTRRNMLATELTESLRRHLLWERQQKNSTAAAVLKRRHTAHDMSNLQAYPGEKLDSKDPSRNNSWNAFYDPGLGQYNQTGW